MHRFSRHTQSWGDGSRTGKGLICEALAEPWGWILCSWDGLSESCSTEARGPNLCTHLLTNPWIQASPEEGASHWAKRLLLAKGSSVQPSASTAPCSRGSGRTGVSSLQPPAHCLCSCFPPPFPSLPSFFSSSLPLQCFSIHHSLQPYCSRVWKILKEMGIPDHLICLLRNLYAGQEATVRTGHRTTDWFQIGKGVCQGCILSPCLFNLYAEFITRNAGLDEAQLDSRLLGEISITSDM